MIPDLKQQISIGSYLKALENFIDIQDKSIENIKRFKKYYLNVIFKSEGA
jgi:restriction endonuclease S subunit